ncbi:MAG: metalloregulator ArsR/SmtB family transcription factor [Anaerolineales bacterium]|jgi:ArsR family transcriptional regulator
MATFSAQARLLKSLGHPTRLQMLRLLEEDEACVCHMAAALQTSQPTVSQHLMALRKAGIVSRRRDGKNIYYRLSRSQIAGLLDLADALAGGTRSSARPRSAADCPCPQCQARGESTAGPERQLASTEASRAKGEKVR